MWKPQNAEKNPESKSWDPVMHKEADLRFIARVRAVDVERCKEVREGGHSRLRVAFLSPSRAMLSWI